jgi:hypothetical protein
MPQEAVPQEADDPISQARQGANWLVGLSGAAIGGSLAKLDWILKFPRYGKVAFLIATFIFLLSILCGVFYAFQLFALKQRKQKLDEVRKGGIAEDIATAQQSLDDANGKVALYHYATLISFALAGVATIVCLAFVLFVPVPPPLPPKPVLSNHYTLINVPVYMGGRLSHSHAFLLNQQTGEAWRMTCRQDKSVEFRRVQWLKLDGTPEDGTAAAKTEATISAAKGSSPE